MAVEAKHFITFSVIIFFLEGGGSVVCFYEALCNFADAGRQRMVFCCTARPSSSCCRVTESSRALLMRAQPSDI